MRMSDVGSAFHVCVALCVFWLAWSLSRTLIPCMQVEREEVELLQRLQHQRAFLANARPQLRTSALGVTVVHDISSESHKYSP